MREWVTELGKGVSAIADLTHVSVSLRSLFPDQVQPETHLAGMLAYTLLVVIGFTLPIAAFSGTGFADTGATSSTNTVFKTMTSDERLHFTIGMMQTLPPLLLLHIGGVALQRQFDDLLKKKLTNSDKWRRALVPSQPVLILIVAMLIHGVQSNLKFFVQPGIEPEFDGTLEGMVTAMAFLGTTSFLDGAYEWMRRLAIDDAHAIQQNKPISKWTAIARAFATFHNEENDAAFGVAEAHQTPSLVMLEIASVYILIGKLLAFIVVTLHFMGVDLNKTPPIIALSVVTGGAISALHINEAHAAKSYCCCCCCCC